MILLDMNNPIPVPPGESVTNFENSFGLISGLIPEPVSLILTLASLLGGVVATAATEEN